MLYSVINKKHMKKLIITETGNKAHQSDAMKLGWLIGTLSGTIKWNDGLSPDTRKFLFNELMSVLDPVKDGALVDSIKASMGEWEFEVREKTDVKTFSVTEPNLLHE
jgi:hypothetical protein